MLVYYYLWGNLTRFSDNLFLTLRNEVKLKDLEKLGSIRVKMRVGLSSLVELLVLPYTTLLKIEI